MPIIRWSEGIHQCPVQTRPKTTSRSTNTFPTSQRGRRVPRLRRHGAPGSRRHISLQVKDLNFTGEGHTKQKKKQVLLGQTGLVGFAATSPKRAKSAPGRDQLGLRHLRQLLRSQQGGGRGDRLSLPRPDLWQLKTGQQLIGPPMGSLQEPQMVDSQDHPNHPTIWVSCLGAPGPSQAGPSNPLRRYSWKPSLNTGTHWDLSLGFRELAFPLPHMGHRNVRDPPPPPPTSQSTWVSYRSLTSPSGNDQP